MIKGLIIAKGHSNRLENKNMLPFHDIPMFMVNIEKCKHLFPEIWVSSDSDEILAIAEKGGAIPIKREENLCGETPNITVYQHSYKQMDSTGMNVTGIVAIQANSPNVSAGIVELCKRALIQGFPEVMTCHPDYTKYGSVWGLKGNRLMNYEDPFNPKPEVFIVDESIDIHTQEDYEKALIL